MVAVYWNGGLTALDEAFPDLDLDDAFGDFAKRAPVTAPAESLPSTPVTAPVESFPAAASGIVCNSSDC